jgi:hypothetical protein
MDADPIQEATDSEDGSTFRYRSAEDHQPMMAIVNAVSWFKGVDATDLEPIHHVINIEQVNELFDGDNGDFYRSSGESAPLELRFQYEACLVTVREDEIDIERATEGQD